MKETIGFKLKDISIMGRSIGSGPAVFAASIYSVGSLILLSPFLSLKEVVRDIYGEICSLLIKQRFNNKERAKLIKCPTLIIHGLLDTIVPPKHSIDLQK
jgi:cephalosporin-C deacetylase-like acetyl esterase